MSSHSAFVLSTITAAGLGLLVSVNGQAAHSQPATGNRSAAAATASADAIRAEIDRRAGGRSAAATSGAPTPLAGVTAADLLDAAMERFGPQVIYGVDDRKDWHEIKSPAIRALAAATVVLIGVNDIETVLGNVMDIKVKPLGEVMQLCPGERFANQSSVGRCSGTLIGPDLILTAGHCVREIARNDSALPLEAIRFVFHFRVERPGGDAKRQALESHVYEGREVVGELVGERGRDWAVVRLSRPVDPSVATPVSLLNTNRVAIGQGVYVIGYPSGIPVKYAAGAVVRENNHPDYFVANLDTYGGNSGSGVFDQRTNALIGILVRGETDYIVDERRRCRRSNICPTTGCRGEDVARLSIVRIPGR